MIPWFVVSVIGAVASIFGRDVYVRAMSDGWGAERIYFVRRTVGSRKTQRWMPIAGRANERLDCRVYALAALRGLMHIGTKLNREADKVGAEVTEYETPEPEPDDADRDATDTLPEVAAAPAPLTDPRPRPVASPTMPPPAQPPPATPGNSPKRRGRTPGTGPRRLA